MPHMPHMPHVPHMMLGLLHASTRSAGRGAVVEHGRTTVRAAGTASARLLSDRPGRRGMDPADSWLP